MTKNAICNDKEQNEAAKRGGFTPGPWTYTGDHTHRVFNIRMLCNDIAVREEARHICTAINKAEGRS